MIAEGVYALCTLTSGTCASAMLLDYRRRRSRILLWSGAAFTGFAISNALVLAAPVMFPGTDLSLVPAAAAALSVTVLLWGLISEVE